MLSKIQKYLLIGLVIGFVFFMVIGVQASTNNDFLENINQEARTIMLMREFSVFLIVVIIALILFLLIGIIGVVKNLEKGASLSKKIKLTLFLLFKEPAYIFSAEAKRDDAGTFKISYEKHKRLHEFTRRNFTRILGLLIIFVVLLIYLSLNNSGANLS